MRSSFNGIVITGQVISLKNMKKMCLTILILALSSTCMSFAQNIDTTGTPSQGAFEVNLPHTLPSAETPSQQAYRIGTPQNVPGTETPSQQSYQAGGNNKTAQGAQPGTTTSTGVVSIYNAVRAGDNLTVLVINSGTAPANMTGWMLALNNGTASYTFPNFALGPGAIVTVHPQAGENSATDLFGSNFQWNETKNVGLLDGRGMIVSEYALTPA